MNDNMKEDQMDVELVQKRTKLSDGQAHDNSNSTNEFKAPTLAKPKKPLTAYFIFMREMKKNKEAESIDMHKNLSNLWSSMTKDEKQKYIRMAEEDKKRYNKEMEEYQKQNPEDSGSDEENVNDSTKNQQIPEFIIKRIMKNDPELLTFKKDTMKILTQITNKFATYLLEESTKTMRKQERKKIKTLDLFTAVESNPAFIFLEGANVVTLEEKELAQLEGSDSKSKKKDSSSKKAEIITAEKKPKKVKVVPPPTGNRSMLDFFKPQ